MSGWLRVAGQNVRASSAAAARNSARAPPRGSPAAARRRSARRASSPAHVNLFVCASVHPRGFEPGLTVTSLVIQSARGADTCCSRPLCGAAAVF
eukprot:7194801-Prymnesium_polylepis.2